MNFSGIILGAAAFFLIGIFHPIVIKAEYYFGKRCWWVFALVGILCCLASVFLSSGILSAILGVAGFSSFWGIRELFEQSERVKKGWFPSNPKRLLCLLFVCTGVLANSSDAFAWGQKGHDITCAIAQRHLTKKTQKKISEILDGRSIVYYSAWMDNASNTPEYRYTKTWHYKNIDADETFDSAPVNENGDVMLAIASQIEALKSGELNHEAQALALKMLIHFVGDMHCPMHMGHRSDLGGNKVQVQYFKQGRNLHSVWDSGIIESARKWGYSEWAEEIDRVSKKQYKEIVAGTPDIWARETVSIATDIYEATPSGASLSYDYVNTWSPVVEQQLLYGGLRLASILNGLFD